MNDGQIITFYSYKGGTGRSMALANAGFLLAGQLPPGSRGVLMIDWDLEAPGLHRYFTDGVQKAFPRPKDRTEPDGAFALHSGLIDFFLTVTEGSQKDPFADFERFVIPTDTERLSILKAGRFDAGYAERIQRFDWEAFHRRDPHFFRAFRQFLMRRYDYALIDSRTGLTDTSGICVQQMPEKLVLVFAPNHQNLDGVLDVARRVRRFRIGSSDLRPLMSFPLASRIDGQNERLREIWRHGGRTRGGEERLEGYQSRFETLFTELYDLEGCDLQDYFDATQIKHDADYAYGERIAAQRGTTDRLSLGYAFAQFTRRLTQLSAPWETLPDESELAEARQRERVATQQQEQVQSKVRVLTWVSITTVLIAAIVFGYNVVLSRRAEEARNQAVLTAARAATDPLEQALLLGELRADTPPEGGLELAQEVAGKPIPFALLRGPSRPVLAVAFSPDGKRLAGVSGDGTTRIWKADGTGSGSRIFEQGANSPPVSLSWREDGEAILVAWKNGELEIRHSRTGLMEGARPELKDQDLLAVTFNAQGQLLIATSQALEVWDLNQRGHNSRYEFFSSRLGRGAPQVARFASLGSRVALTIPGGVQILETRGIKPVASLRIGLPLFAMAFSAKGDRLVTSTAAGVSVWNLESPGEPEVTLDQGSDFLALDPKGRYVALAPSSDGTTSVYSIGAGLARNLPRFELRGPEGPVRALAFSPDGGKLATGSADGTIRIWDLNRAAPVPSLGWPGLLEFIRNQTTACLTVEQRQRLLSEPEKEARDRYQACEKSHGR